MNISCDVYPLLILTLPYYIKNPFYAVSAGLRIERGPQCNDHIGDKSRWYFYGRGLIKYYSLSVLKEEILDHHGQKFRTNLMMTTQQ